MKTIKMRNVLFGITTICFMIVIFLYDVGIDSVGATLSVLLVWLMLIRKNKRKV